jgi:hypothetical protein
MADDSASATCEAFLRNGERPDRFAELLEAAMHKLHGMPLFLSSEREAAASPALYSPNTRRRCSSRISAAMLVRDKADELGEWHRAACSAANRKSRLRLVVRAIASIDQSAERRGAQRRRVATIPNMPTITAATAATKVQRTYS